MQETKSSFKAERLKQKLGKQDFHYDMEEVFEPVTSKQAKTNENQKQLSGKQIQAQRDSTQTTENQTKAIQQSSDILKQAEATGNQKQLSEMQLQAQRDSSQTTTRAISQQTQGFVQAIQDPTRAIREPSNIPKENLKKSFKEVIQEYDEITNRSDQLVTDFVNSNQVDSSIVRTVSYLPNNKQMSIRLTARGR